MNPYIVYVKIDEKNRITAVNSSAFLTDLTGWTKIDSGYGDKYHHAQGNYFEKQIIDERGIYHYKLENGKGVERTQEEMGADYTALPTPEPTQAERTEAQALYTALMTDTLLEV